MLYYMTICSIICKFPVFSLVKKRAPI
jgi:hypothetical protein